MARRQDNHEERPHGTQLLPSPSAIRPSNNVQSTDEDEIVVDADEPPDNAICFGRLSIPKPEPFSRENYSRVSSPNVNRKESLLTQALLTSPTLRSLPYPPSPVSRAASSISNCSTTSIASMAELTSDGGITSPARTNTPSPPLLPMNLIGSAFASPKALDLNNEVKDTTPRAAPRSDTSTIASGDSDVPTRRRCITFACGLGKSLENHTSTPKVDSHTQAAIVQLSTAPKRPCMVRFACPTRTSSEATHKASTDGNNFDTADTKAFLDAASKGHEHNDLPSTISTNYFTEPKAARSADSDSQEMPKARAKYVSEGLRFHEFASQYLEEDEWINQQPASRHKITVNDTLRKEDAIRKLGQEAEEEALEEENAEADLEEELDEFEDNDVVEEDDGNDDQEDDEDVNIEEFDSDGGSDAGNESDNEQGFADSDEESDADSEYRFWRPATTTAATSTDNLEFIRPKTQRTASDSSIESVVNFTVDTFKMHEAGKSSRRVSRPRSIKMRPGTPDLPDSTDFVCGTLDEDRPLEAAYISCIQQRRLAKEPRSPRDFDPSFPATEVDEDEVDDDSLGKADASDEYMWITGQPDDSDIEEHHGNRRPNRRKRVKSPAPLLRRLHSPPPNKHAARLRSSLPTKNRVKPRSSPPRCFLSGSSPRRIRSPLPVHVPNLMSSLLSPQHSVEISHEENSAVNIPRLAQRVDSTFTRSLPKTPNPFWRQIRKSHNELSDNHRAANANGKLIGVADDPHHSRGPIDIVHGLERKRSLRREKCLRQHCRNAGKEKERRCQPGKGAERMRELGLERAGRCKAFGQPQNLMLSI